MNKVILTGRLVADAEVKELKESKRSVVSNSIAVNRNTKNKVGEYETDFINFVVFDKTAEFLAKYINKGDLFGIVGRWQTRNYEDKDGKKRVANEVVVEQLELLGSKKAKAEENSTFEIKDEDIPF